MGCTHSKKHKKKSRSTIAPITNTVETSVHTTYPHEQRQYTPPSSIQQIYISSKMESTPVSSCNSTSYSNFSYKSGSGSASESYSKYGSRSSTNSKSESEFKYNTGIKPGLKSKSESSFVSTSIYGSDFGSKSNTKSSSSS